MPRLPLVAASLATVAGLAVIAMPVRAAEDRVVRAPAARLAKRVVGRTETAILAGGCFWGVQGVFSHVKGVILTTAGYEGGKAATAHYGMVSTGLTGHAEAVRIVFDPTKVNYADLLRIYFSVVTDPTTRDAQGPDEGTQYRSAIFAQSASQDRVARAYIAQLSASHVYAGAIVTRLKQASGFYPAEGYHQNFMAHNPSYPYIVVNDQPKVDALGRMFPAAWRG